MSVDIRSRAVQSGECCPPTRAELLRDDEAIRLTELAKALADPLRVQIVGLLRRREGEVCQCHLTPLFPVGQPTLSHHLRRLSEAGVVDVERRGVWAYYSIRPDALEELTRWLS